MSVLPNSYFRSNATACMSGYYSIGKAVRCLECPAGHKCPTTDVCIEWKTAMKQQFKQLLIL